MTRPTDAQSQTAVQKWVVAIVVTVIAFFIFPPAGLILGFWVGLAGVRRAMARVRQMRIEREQEALRQWRANPWNQQFMPGVADDGGLSIEERNAYRKSANEHRR